jgi:hypothetical protein
MYIYSGGFGNPPSSFTYYNFGLHPFLGKIIQSLFSTFPGKNYYSLALIAAHTISIATLFFLIFRKNKKGLPIILLTLLLVFEGYFLIYLDFTGASVTLTIAAIATLISLEKKKKTELIIPIILFALASLYRIHTMLPIIGVATPFILLSAYSKKQIIPTASIIAISVSLIFVLNLVHQKNYANQRNTWPQEEDFRNSVYKFYNQQNQFKIPKKSEKWYTQYQLVQHGLFFDPSYLNNRILNEMKEELFFKKNYQISAITPFNKWFWINNRIFFCFSLFVFFISTIRRYLAYVITCSLLLFISGLLYLSITAKIPQHIVVSTLYTISLLSLLSSATFFQGKPKYKFIIYAFIPFFLFWSLLRLYKTSTENKIASSGFYNSHAEIAAHKDNLFILTKNSLLQKFYAFDNPASYPLPNYLDSEHFLNNIYNPVFQKFNINNAKDIPLSPVVLFAGPPSDGLVSFFTEVKKKPHQYSEKIANFKSIEVRKIIASSKSN